MHVLFFKVCLSTQAAPAVCIASHIAEQSSTFQQHWNRMSYECSNCSQVIAQSALISIRTLCAHAISSPAHTRAQSQCIGSAAVKQAHCCSLARPASKISDQHLLRTVPLQISNTQQVATNKCTCGIDIMSHI